MAAQYGVFPSYYSPTLPATFFFRPHFVYFSGRELERREKKEPIENKRACYHKRWNCCYKAFRSQFSTVFMLLLKLSCLRSLFTNTKGRRNRVTKGNKRADQERTEYREVAREQRSSGGRKKTTKPNCCIRLGLDFTVKSSSVHRDSFFKGESNGVATNQHAAPIIWAACICHDVVKGKHSLCFMINLFSSPETCWSTMNWRD